MLSVGYEYGVGEKLDGKMCVESRCAHGRGRYTKRRVSLDPIYRVQSLESGPSQISISLSAWSKLIAKFP